MSHDLLSSNGNQMKLFNIQTSNYYQVATVTWEQIFVLVKTQKLFFFQHCIVSAMQTEWKYLDVFDYGDHIHNKEFTMCILHSKSKKEPKSKYSAHTYSVLAPYFLYMDTERWALHIVWTEHMTCYAVLANATQK